MHFPKAHINAVFRYLKLHDGETLLVKNIARDIGCGTWTVSRDLKWLQKRGIIRREGKNIWII